MTDNPLIFLDDRKIISGGNFHGQPLAYAIDFLKISSYEGKKSTGDIVMSKSLDLDIENRSIIRDASIAIPLIKGYRSIWFRNSRNNITT